jgi:hypothetical protein
MARLATSFGRYLRDIFVGTWQTVLVLFDLLGIVLFVHPQVAVGITNNETLVRIIGGLLFLSAFLIANFSLYDRLAAKPDAEFYIERVKNVSFGGHGPIDFIGDATRLAPSLEISVTFRAFVSKPNSPTSARFAVVSVEPDCLYENMPVEDIEVVLQTERHHTRLDNPLRLDADDAHVLEITATIPFSASEIEQQFGSVWRLREITLVLAMRLPGHRPILQSKVCDLKSAHRRVEQVIIQRIKHSGTRSPDSLPKTVQQAKRYWLGPTEEE